MAGKEESQVVELPDDSEIPRPLKSHALIEPFSFYESSVHKSRKCLVILNQSIKRMELPKLWATTELHVCADGGANQLYRYFDDSVERSKYIPDFITGDCDSLTEEVKLYYTQKGTIVIPQYTQYATDFNKALSLVKVFFYSELLKQNLYEEIDSNNGLAELIGTLKQRPSEKDITVYILGGIGGRFDQTVHSISQLYKLNQSHPYLQNIFITESDLIFLVKKGLNYIAYPSKSIFSNSKVPVCGLLPLSNTSVTLNTHGLKYDVSNWKSDMLGNVSSSNGISGVNGFSIDCTDDIVLNVSIEANS